jgi:hypothetical protein
VGLAGAWPVVCRAASRKSLSRARENARARVLPGSEPGTAALAQPLTLGVRRIPPASPGAFYCLPGEERRG